MTFVKKMLTEAVVGDILECTTVDGRLRLFRFWMERYGGRTMEPMYISIRQQETGCRIKKLLADNGYTVKDVQGVMGFENPQAIYKWISGKSLPSLDNLVILTRLLHTSIENILVLDEGVLFFGVGLNYRFNDKRHIFM